MKADPRFMSDELPQLTNLGFDVETPDIPIPEVRESSSVVADTIDTAFKLAFIGSGQGGSRLAQSFHELGYARVCALNSTAQDMQAITLPETHKLVVGHGGAGKNPQQAADWFAQSKEDVLDFMRRCFGSVFDRIIVCAGAGGGTGAGTVLPLVQTAHDLQQALKCSTDKVGVILALPKNSEGKKVNENAYFVLEKLLAQVSPIGPISPLILLDNERIHNIFPGLAIDQFWGTANRSIASLFNLFNTITTKNSTYTTFDPNDWRSILDSGVIVFGATAIKQWGDATHISHAIRDNLKRNILSGGLDLSTGTVAAGVIIAGRSVLREVPAEYLDHAYEQLTRLLKRNSTVHRGIYSGSQETMVAYTAVGGLGQPTAKLEELRRLGDVLLNQKPDVGTVMGESSRT